MSYREEASKSFPPSHVLAAQVARTRDIDTLVGVMLTTNPAVPLRRKWDAAVRMVTYLPAFIHASLTAIAMAVAGKEALEAELTSTGEEKERSPQTEHAKRILMEVYRKAIDNIEYVRRIVSDLNLDPPPALGDVKYDGTVLGLVDAMSKALSNYYISQVERYDRARDLMGFTYTSARLAAAIADPIRAYLRVLT